ncbi:MAG: hypothetical protein VW983_06740 [Halieaceae bacterium]
MPTPTGKASPPEKGLTTEVLLEDAEGPGFSFPWFVSYKFFNSLFLGLSIGSVFTLYAPLDPSTFSAGGIGLAIATLLIATQYHRLFTRLWFFRLSVLVEAAILSGVIAVLTMESGQRLALFIYLGYQLSFAFGSYLVRFETLLISGEEQLKTLDIAKQAAYLLGMGLAWLTYRALESRWAIEDADAQVKALYGVLLIIEAAVFFTLLKSFPNRPKTVSV